MKRRTDLIDHFTELVLGAGEPRRLAERTLEVVMSLTNGRSGAVFARDGDHLNLFASRAIDQHALNAVQEAWGKQAEVLRRGETFYVPDWVNERRISGPNVRGGPASFTIVPTFEGDELIALLYVDSLDPHFCEEHDLSRLEKFSRIIAKAVRESATTGTQPAPADAWETYLERTPVEDMEREKLLLLLNRNEWNIARVARLMGVTRRTVYLRLQRYNIPRERVPKSRPRVRRDAHEDASEDAGNE
jgi:transcriptional regulator with GAF, ATPase, and Fis domain